MTKLIFLPLFIFTTFHLFAQKNMDCHSVNVLETQNEIIVNGNLKDGCLMPLEWAANSSVACFPATRFFEYKGNHILYSVEMPARSKMIITVIPKKKKQRINLYALRLGVNNGSSPPDIPSAISCEASYPIYAGKPNTRSTPKAQSVEYISIRKPYNIVIGVAGAKDILEGDFELKIEISER